MRLVSLTVYLNGERRGGMVASGLVGPLRWVVDVTEASVRIDGPKPPPAVTAEDLAEDARKQREFDDAQRSDSDDE